MDFLAVDVQNMMRVTMMGTMMHSEKLGVILAETSAEVGLKSVPRPKSPTLGWHTSNGSNSERNVAMNQRRII